jgi:hypothetical protein
VEGRNRGNGKDRRGFKGGGEPERIQIKKEGEIWGICWQQRVMPTHPPIAFKLSLQRKLQILSLGQGVPRSSRQP